jgi:hypothetical protein
MPQAGHGGASERHAIEPRRARVWVAAESAAPSTPRGEPKLVRQAGPVSIEPLDPVQRGERHRWQGPVSVASDRPEPVQSHAPRPCCRRGACCRPAAPHCRGRGSFGQGKPDSLGSAEIDLRRARTLAESESIHPIQKYPVPRRSRGAKASATMTCPGSSARSAANLIDLLERRPMSATTIRVHRYRRHSAGHYAVLLPYFRGRESLST